MEKLAAIRDLTVSYIVREYVERVWQWMATKMKLTLYPKLFIDVDGSIGIAGKQNSKVATNIGNDIKWKI